MPIPAQAGGRQGLPGFRSGCWPLGLIDPLAKESGGKRVTRIAMRMNYRGDRRLPQGHGQNFPRHFRAGARASSRPGARLLARCGKDAIALPRIAPTAGLRNRELTNLDKIRTHQLGPHVGIEHRCDGNSRDAERRFHDQHGEQHFPRPGADLMAENLR